MVLPALLAGAGPACRRAMKTRLTVEACQFEPLQLCLSADRETRPGEPEEPDEDGQMLILYRPELEVLYGLLKVYMEQGIQVMKSTEEFTP